MTRPVPGTGPERPAGAHRPGERGHTGPRNTPTRTSHTPTRTRNTRTTEETQP